MRATRRREHPARAIRAKSALAARPRDRCDGDAGIGAGAAHAHPDERPEVGLAREEGIAHVDRLRAALAGEQRAVHGVLEVGRDACPDEVARVSAFGLLGRHCQPEANLGRGDDLARLEPLHQQLQAHASGGDIDQYYATNALIHVAVQSLADNRWLSDLIDGLRKVLNLSRHKSLAFPGRIQESCAEHLAIFAALKARDPEGAEALTRKHVMRQLDALHALAEQSEPGSPPL